VAHAGEWGGYQQAGRGQRAAGQPCHFRQHERLARRKGATGEQIMEAIRAAAKMRAGGAYAHATLALNELSK
jgi:alkylhydroperoxidase/carboxymuconolactone decarboxylase family protein YurZ